MQQQHGRRNRLLGVLAAAALGVAMPLLVWAGTADQKDMSDEWWRDVS